MGLASICIRKFKNAVRPAMLTAETARSSEPNLDQIVETTIYELAKFWSASDRYETLRKAFRTMCLELEMGPGSLHRHIRTITKKYCPCEKSLERYYGESEQNTLRKKVVSLTAILFVCLDFISNNERLKVEATKLSGLYNELQAQCALNIQKIREPLQTKADLSGIQYEKDQLEKILHLLRVPQIDDWQYPEFPLLNPRTPATRTREIEIDGRKIFVKDEGENPTGSHKDRASHEICLNCIKPTIEECLMRGPPYILPRCSIISAGSMARALQYNFNLLRLPYLSVLQDRSRHDKEEVQFLEAMGARVILCDLDEKLLTADDVLLLSENAGGIDLTVRSLEQVLKGNYYDWGCHEILELCPKHIFVPVGNGDLFASIIHVIERGLTGQFDLRLKSGGESLRNVTVYGATTHDPNSQMRKLYAKFRPTLADIEIQLDRCKQNKFVGKMSGIYPIEESNAHQAMAIFASNGIPTEISASAGLGLFLRMANEIPVNEKVLVVNTGRIYLPRILH